MKLNFIYTFFALSLAFCLFSSSKNGRANAANNGNTGAPGDQLTMSGQPWVCQTCHNSAAIQVTQNLTLTDTDGNDVFATGYTPGQTYTATLTIDPAVGNPTGYGFQMVALNAPLDVPGPEVSDWTAVSSNVQIATASQAMGRTYVEHDGVSATNEFTMTWTAPAIGSGEVTFYAASNGVNGNNETGGDGSTAGKYSLLENETSSTKNLTLAIDMNLFPNPAQSQVSVTINTEDVGQYNWAIVDMLGRSLQKGQFNLPQGESNQSISLANMTAGLYQFQLIKDGKSSNQYLVKK